MLEFIDQPTLLIDKDQAIRNIRYMTEKASRLKVRFRPHFKTHQSAEIGEWFRQLGVSRITVSSVEMGEYFANHGWQDILIAFSVNIRQWQRIEKLANRIHLELLVENTEAVSCLAEFKAKMIDVWVKIDVGNGRTGIDWQNGELVEKLCRMIAGQPGLRLRGLLTHSGNTYQAKQPSEIPAIFREGVSRLVALRESLSEKGITKLEISVGDTPGCSLSDDFSDIDEIRPGNFVFYDAQQWMSGSCRIDQIAVGVACPVVAKHANRRELVVYGGAIHLSKDFLFIDGEKSFGAVAFNTGEKWGYPIADAVVRGLSQEHGMVRLPQPDFEKVQIGDLIFIIPAHSCLTVQVMGEYRTLDGKKISTMN